jgi:hypothetical protein
VGKLEGKRPPGRPRHIWVNDIQMVLRDVEWCDIDWIHLAEGRDQCSALVNTVMNLQFPENADKFIE